MMERKNKAQRKFVSLLECICKHSTWTIQILKVLLYMYIGQRNGGTGTVMHVHARVGYFAASLDIVGANPNPNPDVCRYTLLTLPGFILGLHSEGFTSLCTNK